MKTGILTYYGIYNHGAVLQANALKTVLESMGCDVTFLRYQRNYDMISEWDAKKFRLGFSSIPYYIKYAAKKGVNNILFIYKKKKIFDRFRNENFKIGERYTDFVGDLVVIGSDEVFALDIGINPFFYGHAIKSKKIISYAGSFGKTTESDIQALNCINLIQSGFELQENISVRDKNSYEIVKSFGFKPSLVCDPVILYGYEKEQTEFVPKLKNYIVIYSYDKNMNDNHEISEIRKYAQKNHLKIYSVGGYHKWCDKNINCTPIELLGYIKNSKLVITDTFHGTVLSIITNTNFVVKIRDNKNKLYNLLSEYELTDRMWDSEEFAYDIANTTIEYNRVNEIIRNNRLNAMQFLQSAIENYDKD